MNETGLPLEIERKYLIRRPDEALLRSLPESQPTEITQTYLTTLEDGYCRRVRKRGSADSWQYTYTRKKSVSTGTHIELEDEITADAYTDLLAQADPARQVIRKTRWCVPYGGFLLEIDIYAFSSTLATLEVELADIDTPVRLPDWADVIADVTGDRRYSNAALAASLAFPETED